MAYQLRFLKISPISSWINQTASLLEICMYFRPKIGPPLDFNPGDKNRRLIRKALIKGLSGFLAKRSLCDTHPDCDLGLRPAAENKNDDRFEAGVINAPVKRYLFQGDTDLDGAVEKIVSALSEKNSEISFDPRKVKFILKESLANHLFENPNCFHHAYCRHSILQKIDRDFAFPRRDFKNHGKHP